MTAPTPNVRRAPHLSKAIPVRVEKTAKTIILVENIRDVSALDQPNSSINATKNTVNERRIPNTTVKVMLQTATIIHP
jgi:hypothetical protein